FCLPSDLCCPFRVLPSGGGRVGPAHTFDVAVQAPPIALVHAPAPGGRHPPDWHNRGAHKQRPGSRFALSRSVRESAASEHRVARHPANRAVSARVTTGPTL